MKSCTLLALTFVLGLIIYYVQAEEKQSSLASEIHVDSEEVIETNSHTTGRHKRDNESQEDVDEESKKRHKLDKEDAEKIAAAEDEDTEVARRNRDKEAAENVDVAENKDEDEETPEDGKSMMLLRRINIQSIF
uniref:Uncharacterized protein n=1 Tax=Acrobeloides nanus TaxID=290746 RepID=A0A914ELW3_9BILA